MKEGLIKDTTELILKEIQSIVSIAYILIVGIGMLFNYQKYAEFGINIFDYADILEFLIAPFSDPIIFLFSITSVVLAVIAISIDIYWKEKHPKSYSVSQFGLDKKSWFNIYRYTLYSCIFVSYLYFSAGFYASESYKEIKKTKSIAITYSDNSIITGKLIGKTNEVLFLLQHKKVKAIPFTSLVKEFDVSRIKKKD